MFIISIYKPPFPEYLGISMVNSCKNLYIDKNSSNNLKRLKTFTDSTETSEFQDCVTAL